MSTLGKNWKAIVAILLLLAAVVVFFLIYRPAKAQHEQNVKNKTEQIAVYQMRIESSRPDEADKKYLEIQPQLAEEAEKLQESRKALYENFPTEMKEEDQILYVLYLEELFGNDIYFWFGGINDHLTRLSDFNVLYQLELTVNYETTYDKFQELVDYLATDSTITSVKYATMNYNESTDQVSGSFTLLRYLMVPWTYDSDTDYSEPEIDFEPEAGKANLFD